MIKAAFYAPLKPPCHPTPSGDRTMARALVAALESSNIAVDLASAFQSRDGAGDASFQARQIATAQIQAQSLIPAGRQAGWQVWITYHNYYKAPDLIGPIVSKALGIPYLLVESTRARKRLTGAWADYAEAAEAASDAASTIFYLTQRDAAALRASKPIVQKLVHLRPFLPTDTLPPLTNGHNGMLSVGMFRAGDKLDSYKIIAQTLAQLRTPSWHLSIAGDGPQRSAVNDLMAPFQDHITWLGKLDDVEMAQAYARHAILFWPGVNEAFGMTYLEAQAAGLVVVAQDRPGVCDVLAPGSPAPTPEEGAAALAASLDHLLARPAKIQRLGLAARDYIRDNHLAAQAQESLSNTIKESIQ